MQLLLRRSHTFRVTLALSRHFKRWVAYCASSDSVRRLEARQYVPIRLLETRIEKLVRSVRPEGHVVMAANAHPKQPTSIANFFSSVPLRHEAD
jgi:hypothetical protein